MRLFCMVSVVEKKVQDCVTPDQSLDMSVMMVCVASLTCQIPTGSYLSRHAV